jgi:hypothetical protein
MRNSAVLAVRPGALRTVASGEAFDSVSIDRQLVRTNNHADGLALFDLCITQVLGGDGLGVRFDTGRDSVRAAAFFVAAGARN